MEDLASTPEETALGFAFQAEHKTHLAPPYLKSAEEFRAGLDDVQNLPELLARQELRDDLLTAVGISAKAKKYFTSPSAISHLEKVLLPILARSDRWRDELFQRFLLTSGDSLGGQMRNVIGKIGGDKFIDEVLNQLSLSDEPVVISRSKTGKVTSIGWENRLLLLDSKPKWIDKNVDAILLNSESNESVSDLRENPNVVLACGEIKGGADPAGSDEHWKTAQTALLRIADRFDEKEITRPILFFLGLAIEKSVSISIADEMQRGKLDYAANLARPQQVADLVNRILDI
jgi:type II restriction enzyme